MLRAPMLVGQRSRNRITPFRLHRPETIAEAAEAGSVAGAVYMAGGQDLIGRMKEGARPAEVVHLGKVRALHAIERSAGGVRIGALARHADVASDPAVRTIAPDLADAWARIGNPRVRHAGTVGGNIMAATPQYDAELLLGAVGASATFFGRTACDALPLAGHPGTALLLHIDVPAGTRLLLDRTSRPCASVALGLKLEAGRIVSARLTVGCAYPQTLAFAVPLSAPESPRRLAGRAAEIAEVLVRAFPEPLDDWRGSAAHRRRILRVLVERLLAHAGDVAC